MFSPVQTEMPAIDSNYLLASRFGRKMTRLRVVFHCKEALPKRSP